MEKGNVIKLVTVIIGVVLLGFMIILYSKNGKISNEMSRARVLDEESIKKDKGKQVFLIPKDDIQKISITDANGIVMDFEYSDDHWQYLDDKTLALDEDRIDKVLNYLCDVRCIGTITEKSGDKYGLNQSSKEYRVTDTSGSTIIISLGNYDEDKKEQYFSINYDFATIYINSGKLTKVSEYTAADLIIPQSEANP